MKDTTPYFAMIKMKDTTPYFAMGIRGLYEFYLEYCVQWSQGETPLNFEEWKETQGDDYKAMKKLVRELISAPKEEE